MAAKFSLVDVITSGNVSNSDTAREQIEYIDISLIDSDPNNFYSLSDLDELVSNIELIGLQQPIRVRTNPEDPQRVIIVSGHRRRAALQRLVDDGREDLRQVPCIREAAAASAAMQELRLIYANSDTRKMSSADLSKQVERVEMLLYQLKEEGIEFPGRMRDHVAEACKVSKTKLARLKVIRDNLDKSWAKYYEKGDLNESCAYTLAQMPKDRQKTLRQWARDVDRNIKWLSERELSTKGKRLQSIAGLKCSCDGGTCINTENKEKKSLSIDTYSYHPCDSCCSTCRDLTKCKYACPNLSARIKELKADASAQRKQERVAQEERDRPVVSRLMALWNRFGQSRAAADKSLDEYCKAIGISKWALGDESKVVATECLEVKFNPGMKLPYGYSCYLSDVDRFVKAADLFGVSLDYLLCRTDDPCGGIGAKPELSGPAWHAAADMPPIGEKIIVVDDLGVADTNVYEGNGTLRLPGCKWGEVVLWTLAPSGATVQQPPAESLTPLRYRPGKEMPEKDGQKAVAKFLAPGMDKPMEMIARWDAFSRQWRFKSNAASIECECVGWFPVPDDEEVQA